MGKPTDEIDKALFGIKGERLRASERLSTEQKQAIVDKLGGPRTVASIIKAKAEFPLRRIPWIFSSLDSQCVWEVLHHDFSGFIKK